MSRSTIAKRKSSPCCIGCIVLLVIAIGFSLAIGIYMYRFATNNISMVNVATKTDPALDTPPAELLPEKVGTFNRTSLLDTLEGIPDLKDKATTGAHVAVYQNPEGDEMTVIAVPTAAAIHDRQTGIGILTAGRGKANSTDVGISIKDTFSGPYHRTITTWSKPHWTFMVQTSSTLTSQFVENFHPGGGDLTSGTLPESTAMPEMNPEPQPVEQQTPPTDEPTSTPQSAPASLTEPTTSTTTTDTSTTNT